MSTYSFDVDAPLTGGSWPYGGAAVVDVRTRDGVRHGGGTAPAIGTGLPMTATAGDLRRAASNPQPKRERTTPGNTPPGALSS